MPAGCAGSASHFRISTGISAFLTSACEMLRWVRPAGEDLLIDGDVIAVQEDDSPDLVFRKSGKLRCVSGSIIRCGREVDRQKDRFHDPRF